MAFIRVIPDEEWTEPGNEELGEQFNAVVDPGYGRIDHIMAVHSLNPRGLAAHNALYMSAMRGTASLRKVERELIAYVVSVENQCHY